MTQDVITDLARSIRRLSPKAFDVVCDIERVLSATFPDSGPVLALSAACAARRVLRRR